MPLFLLTLGTGNVLQLGLSSAPLMWFSVAFGSAYCSGSAVWVTRPCHKKWCVLASEFHSELDFCVEASFYFELSLTHLFQAFKSFVGFLHPSYVTCVPPLDKSHIDKSPSTLCWDTGAMGAVLSGFLVVLWSVWGDQWGTNVKISEV